MKPDLFSRPPLHNFKKIYPLAFNNGFINIKQNVEHYLSTTFYNLTAVVLHDWETYGKMSRLIDFDITMYIIKFANFKRGITYFYKYFVPAQLSV